jgi:alkylated DNA repair dioxygenase AlkB
MERLIFTTTTGKSSLKVVDNFLDKDLSDSIFEYMKNNENWLSGLKTYRGVHHRSLIFMSDVVKSYYYSGSNISAIKLNKFSRYLLDKVNTEILNEDDEKYNAILWNRYETGDDYVGAHADVIPKHIKNRKVVSISFGDSRKFRISLREDSPEMLGGLKVIDHETEENQLIIMDGKFQKELLHSIVKEKGKKLRISATFRYHRPN